jgi:hypothetical protein
VAKLGHVGDPWIKSGEEGEGQGSDRAIMWERSMNKQLLNRREFNGLGAALGSPF